MSSGELVRLRDAAFEAAIGYTMGRVTREAAIFAVTEWEVAQMMEDWPVGVTRRRVERHEGGAVTLTWEER